MSSLLWQPSPDRIDKALVTAFIDRVNRRHGRQFDGMQPLWQWSVADPAAFWREVWDFTGVIGLPGDRVVDHPERMPGDRWFAEARLNFAENLLRRQDHGDAIVFWGENKVKRRLSHGQLYTLVARLA